ncbi:fungal-specific transcription factor domain-containing protein [Microdochium trichocladiopsis]|uniref:Fungal-specific transcription factor domain-containing protein n=1 Tax=Microdochium trichocladiopsis TaxID=1682393 RepID=A0A9P9BMW9_9PEZI|nr:fungal-specific transcription factor domain-containing protein [Microdochium trichocladiopsis]KAH7018227.1 fungal-specific transcription factor domain-containing protein [Microdochium trichocladiopsis]
MEEDNHAARSGSAPRRSVSETPAAGKKHEAPESSPPDSTHADGESGSAAAKSSAAHESQSKRRRGLGVVTPNACTECRKKRAKCDGNKPCGRCKSQKDVECVYEVPVRQSKENLRTEIDSLRREKRQSDSILSALHRSDLAQEVIQRLRTGHKVEDIADWLSGYSSAEVPGPVPPISQLSNFGRTNEPMTGITLPPLGGYLGMISSPSSFAAPMAPSPVPSQQHPNPFRNSQDFGSNSPWDFSSHSQGSGRSDSYAEHMQWSAEPRMPRVGSWVQAQSPTDNSQRYPGVEQVLATPGAQYSKATPVRWTLVTRDAALVQHLLALYFCWEYPTFASLSKEHFLTDFWASRPRFCSQILVNALLALGCRFSSHPHTRADPNDPYTSGDHFFKEALRLFHQEKNHHSLTTIQALGIMSIREASCGRDSESWYYAGQSMRLAFEMGLHYVDQNGNEDEVAVQSATFWGAFALDHAWSLATGSLPQSSCYPHLPPKPAIVDDVEASQWKPYTDDGSDNLGAPLQRSCEQPSNVRSVYKCFCELSELVHQSLYVLHSPGKPVTSRDLLSIYTQYLNWYESIPEVLRLGHNFTPAVLFAHMYYHFAILLLFRPLIKLRIIGSSILPRDVCSQAADAIQGLLRSYAQLYTLRRTPSFVPYFLLTSSIMHLALGAKSPDEQQDGDASASRTPGTKSEERSSRGQSVRSDSETDRSDGKPMRGGLGRGGLIDRRAAQALEQGISDLEEMAPCHHFAEQALHMLRYLAKKWKVEIDIPEKPDAAPGASDKLMRPNTSGLNFFSLNMGESDFVCEWPAVPGAGVIPSVEAQMDELQKFNKGGMGPPLQPSPGGGGPGLPLRGASSAGPMAHTAASIENPLFWPFPMQGRPMLPEGKHLEEAGFAQL